jgi:hypothetical protein
MACATDAASKLKTSLLDVSHNHVARAINATFVIDVACATFVIDVACATFVSDVACATFVSDVACATFVIDVARAINATFVVERSFIAWLLGAGVAFAQC